MTYIDASLFVAGFVSWAVSTLSAGGGSMLMVAAAGTMLGGHAVAPVVTFTSVVAAPARMAFFWSHIDWRLVRWYAPGAAAGATLGGWVFTLLSAQWVQTCVALFLISTAWQYRAGERARSFGMRLHWFPLVSFASGLTSAVVGASGLLANPFYLNYGMVKERMIATRAVNSLAIQIAKIGAYAAFGILSWEVLRYGLTAGAGATLAIWVSRPWLRRLPSRRFRQFAVLVMVLSGILVLWHQRAWLLGGSGRASSFLE